MADDIFNSILNAGKKLVTKKVKQSLPQNTQKAMQSLDPKLMEDIINRTPKQPEVQEPGMWDKISNFFTDDPNSGWYDEMRNRQRMDEINKQYGSMDAGSFEESGYMTPEKQAQAAAVMKGNAPAEEPGMFSKIGTAFGNAMKSAATPGLIGAASGLGGYLASKGERDAADAAMNRATDLASQMNYLQDPEMAKVQDNAAALAARSKALQGIQDRANMGLTPEEQLELKNIRNQQNQNFQAQQKQIQENMARQGMGNSGAALAQMMGNSQAQNQLASQQADQTAAMSFAAKQNALQNLGNMASGIVQQDFSRDTQRAGAKDQVSQFNVNQQNARNRAMQQAQQQQANWQQQKAKDKAANIGNIGQSFGTAVSGYQAGLDPNKKK